MSEEESLKRTIRDRALRKMSAHFQTEVLREWARKPHTRINWMMLEQKIRAVLDTEIHPYTRLVIIDELIAAYTRRGHTL